MVAEMFKMNACWWIRKPECQPSINYVKLNALSVQDEFERLFPKLYDKKLGSLAQKSKLNARFS